MTHHNVIHADDDTSAGSADKPGSVTVTITGSTAITVTWTDSINCLHGITPGLTQTVQPGLSGTYTVKARLANLAAGSYSGAVTISGGGITKQVPATLIFMAVTATNAASSPGMPIPIQIWQATRCTKRHRRVPMPHLSRRYQKARQTIPWQSFKLAPPTSSSSPRTIMQAMKVCTPLRLARAFTNNRA